MSAAAKDLCGKFSNSFFFLCFIKQTEVRERKNDLECFMFLSNLKTPQLSMEKEI